MSKYEELLNTHFKAYKLKPEREFRFCADRKWRFDFAFPDRNLAIEIEGGTWSLGRHTRGHGFAADCSKYNRAVLEGWRVLRFPSEQVASGEAIQTILKALVK